MKNSSVSAQTITMSGMLIALGVILSFIRLPISVVTEITFTGLPIAAGGYLFGPWIGFVIGALIDVCGFFAAPKGMYFPGFTVSAGLVGMIYGLLLWRRWWQKKDGRNSLLRNGNKGLAVRAAAAHFLKTALISLCLNCLWLSMFFGMDFKAVVIASLPKELINFPVEVFLIICVIRLFMRIYPEEETLQHEK